MDNTTDYEIFFIDYANASGGRENLMFFFSVRKAQDVRSEVIPGLNTSTHAQPKEN
jgi:hypothetical protein